MSNHSPIPSPPPELVQQWEEQFLERPTINGCFVQSYIADKAARWGADQELEACCQWLSFYSAASDARDLRTARRPKPPSLKEQALAVLMNAAICDHLSTQDEAILRRALEALPND